MNPINEIVVTYVANALWMTCVIAAVTSLLSQHCVVALLRIGMHCGSRHCCSLSWFPSRACADLETMTNREPRLSQK